MDKKDFQALWDKAVAAGKAAGNAAVPVPMVVSQRANPLNDNSPAVKEWFVADGVCGFAWVKVKPGNSAFANWLKKKGYARKDSYGGGVSISVSDYNQSMARKEAHAYAMADVFQAAGFKAYGQSRMD